MEKLLPIVKENCIVSECWNSYIISAVLSRKSLYPWYVERFIDFYINRDLSCKYQQFNPYSYEYVDYSEVVEYEHFDDNHEIIEKIKRKIDEEKYVMIYLNLTDLLRKKYMIRSLDGDYLQDVMVIGYNNTSFHCCIMINDELNVLPMEQSALKSNFYSACSIINKNPQDYTWLYSLNLPISCFRLKDNVTRKVEVNHIRLVLYSMLNPQIIKIINSNNVEDIIYHGLAVYDVLGEAMNLSREISSRDDKTLYAIIKIFNKLHESRNRLVFRMEYLEKKCDICFSSEEFDSVECLNSELVLTKNVFIKYSITLDKRLLIDFDSRIKRCKDYEHTALNLLYKKFDDLIINRTEKLTRSFI